MSSLSKSVQEVVSSELPVVVVYPLIESTLDIILSNDITIRNISLNDYIVYHYNNNNNKQQQQQQQEQNQQNHQQYQHEHLVWLLEQCHILDTYRRRTQQQSSSNLYEQVRACFFLYTIYRYHIVPYYNYNNNNNDNNNNNNDNSSITSNNNATKIKIPYDGYQCLQNRQYNDAIDIFLHCLTSLMSNDNTTTTSTTTTSTTKTTTTTSTTTTTTTTIMTTTMNGAIASALAQAYYELSFQLLFNQVRISVQHYPGNAWMYNVTIDKDKDTENGGMILQNYPTQFHIQNELLHQQNKQWIKESTPVRMDLTHCGWSDIFFLGMDYPEGAQVINCSINLRVIEPITSSTNKKKVMETYQPPIPPIDTYIQIIDNESILKLTSIDLQTECTIQYIHEIFDYGKDYLGLLKAGIIASGIIPIGLEEYCTTINDGQDKTTQPQPIPIPISAVFDTTIGKGKGLHLVTHVRDIPKGSRLAVSTNLLASIITIGMRATGQFHYSDIIGPLLDGNSTTGSSSRGSDDIDRRMVAARAILGEWLGGSGGGWQDSGGIWPGIKLIQGVLSSSTTNHNNTDNNNNNSKTFHRKTSRGELLPRYRTLTGSSSTATSTTSEQQQPVHHPSSIEKPLLSIEQLQDLLQNHLLLVHGGMACNVGPILNMVTEKYLLRETKEWHARQDCLTILQEMITALQNHQITDLAALTHRNFFGPYRTIIPWASNLYTETLIERIQSTFQSNFLGFWMLGGASGGGMGFLFQQMTTIDDRQQVITKVYDIMLATKRELETAIPFAMDPVVYDFAINTQGTVATWVNNDTVPSIRPTSISSSSTTEQQEKVGNANGESSSTKTNLTLDDLLTRINFDQTEHENIRQQYINGTIGLSQNRLPIDTVIEDVQPENVIYCSISNHWSDDIRQANFHYQRGLHELQNGTVAVVTLAAGVGSRWTSGAGCVKALNPFCRLHDKFRSFLEVHLSKSQRISNLAGQSIPHIITTSVMTNDAIQSYLDRTKYHGYDGPVYVSLGQTMGVRLIPTVSDLEYLYQQQNAHKLDEQAQKVRESCQCAMKEWAEQCGEGNDYRDNIPMQCLHPVGHFYEIPNLLLNGTLQRMLQDRPQLQYLMLHNVDTVGANVDPAVLGLFVSQENKTLAFEVISRQVHDVGGGLANVNGKIRMIEGLALPNDEDEFKFSYYNSMTTWIHIDKLLSKFGLDRSDLLSNHTTGTEKVTSAVYTFARQLPTYVTLKEVKKRWGNAQEDVVLTAQFEKLWSDMTGIDNFIDEISYFVVPRYRGSQLKDVSQLDGWLRDGSAAFVESICSW